MITMNVKPTIDPMLLNIGCGMDLPTANLVVGDKGEIIVNGGLDYTTGFVGPGNSYKTALLLYALFTAIDRVIAVAKSYLLIYDSENTLKTHRLQKLIEKYERLKEEVVNDPSGSMIQLTNKANYYGDEIITAFRDMTKEIQKSDKKIKYRGYNLGKVGAYKDYVPRFLGIDSMSKLKPKLVEDMVHGARKEDNSIAHVDMRDGKWKANLILDMSNLTAKANIRVISTAHIGKDGSMDGGNKYNKPTKKLHFLKEGETIKGVSAEYFNLTSTIWLSSKSTVLKNQTTKLPEYPIGDDIDQQATDLMVVGLSVLRSKNGPSGVMEYIVISQADGVLEDLSNFHNVKLEKFGISGNDRFYHMDLYPDKTLSKGKVRKALEQDKKLCRAVQITRDIQQAKIYQSHTVRSGLWCTPKELYDGIIEAGYDWDELLQTRNWCAIDNYHPDLPPYLSVFDLFRMRKGMYTPYWHKKTKKGEK